MFFVGGVLVISLMFLLASLGTAIRSFVENCCPVVSRMAARFARRLSCLFSESEDFYCFFHKDSLYGN
jgi:hypothetical protein